MNELAIAFEAKYGTEAAIVIPPMLITLVVGVFGLVIFALLISLWQESQCANASKTS